MKNNQIKTRAKQKEFLSILLALSLMAISTVAWAQPKKIPPKPAKTNHPALTVPNFKKRQAPNKPAECVADEILLMPSKDADKDEINKLITEEGGQIVQTLGSGELTTYVVRVEHKKFEGAEKDLGKDKHFKAIQRNCLSHAGTDYGNCSLTSMPNDPDFSSEWYLSALNATAAWALSTGRGAKVVIADSGCSAANPDLGPNLKPGLDCTLAGGNGCTDRLVIDGGTAIGHGTMITTSAFAVGNNKLLTVGPAYNAAVYPVDVVVANRTCASDANIIQAIIFAEENHIRVFNCSYGADGMNSFANPQAHPALTAYLQWYYNNGGLAFFSTGDSGLQIPAQFTRQPYLLMVSGIDQNYRLWEGDGYKGGADYGNCTWFTGPSTYIYCSDPQAHLQTTMGGTSFSSPLCASVAALILSANPGLTNQQVINIMVKSCENATPSPNQYFGYGLPNAALAVWYALGGL